MRPSPHKQPAPQPAPQTAHPHRRPSRRIALITAVGVLAAGGASLALAGPGIAAPAPASAAVRAAAAAPQAASPGLADPHKKEIAMELVSSAENSSLDWKAQYKYIEDIGDGRGYTAGIIGFCSGTGDMLDLVEYYTGKEPGNPLARYLPALRKVNGSASHAGLG